MSSSPPSAGLRIARIAFVVGILYAAISFYWGLGGTWLLDTVGGSLARQGRAGDFAVIFAVWVAVVLKVLAAVLPLLALRDPASPAQNRQMRVLAWMAAGILTTYGAVQTIAGLLVQADIVHASANADHRALAWHAYFWDPWFLVWGLLVTLALALRSRRIVVTPAGR